MIALQDLAPAAPGGGSLGGVFPVDVDERFVRPFLQAYRMQVQAGLLVLLVALAAAGAIVWVLRRRGRIGAGGPAWIAMGAMAALACGVFFDLAAGGSAASHLRGVVATEPGPPPLRAFVREVRRQIPSDADVFCVLAADPRATLAGGGGGAAGGAAPIALLEAATFLAPRRLWLDPEMSFGPPEAVPRAWLRERSIDWLLIVRSYGDFACRRVAPEGGP